MCWVPRATAALALILSLAGGTGCRRERGRPVLDDGASRPLPALRPVPREVLAYLGLKDPRGALDGLLGIIREFAAPPLDSDGLLDLLARQAGLPGETLPALDTGGTSWAVILDPRQLDGQEATVLALPLRSRAAFVAALGRRMNRVAQEGDLVRFRDRESPAGQELLIHLEERLAILSGSRRALAITLPFLRANLLPRPPHYHLDLHLLVERLGAERPLLPQISRALGKVQARLGSAPLSPDRLRSPVPAGFSRRLTELTQSLRELIFTVEVDRRQLTLSLRGEARGGGPLHQLIGRQRPAEPFGHRLLPGTSWLVLSASSPVTGATPPREGWPELLPLLLPQLEPAQRRRGQRAVTALRAAFSGDFTLALHRATSGSGLALSAVCRTSRGRARQALDQLATLVSGILEGQASARGLSLRTEKRHIIHQQALGVVIAAAAELPEGQREEAQRLLGPEPAFGYLLVGDLALLAAGKDVEQQLRLMADGVTAGQVKRGLGESPAFRRARSSPGRTGLLYLSLVDLARWFEGTGIGWGETVAAALRDQRVAAAPTLDWGVNAARTQLDLSLRLPLEHFRAFKPILEQMQAVPRLLPGGPASPATESPVESDVPR